MVDTKGKKEEGIDVDHLFSTCLGLVVIVCTEEVEEGRWKVREKSGQF